MAVKLSTKGQVPGVRAVIKNGQQVGLIMRSGGCYLEGCNWHLYLDSGRTDHFGTLAAARDDAMKL